MPQDPQNLRANAPSVVWGPKRAYFGVKTTGTSDTDNSNSDSNKFQARASISKDAIPPYKKPRLGTPKRGDIWEEMLHFLDVFQMESHRSPSQKEIGEHFGKSQAWASNELRDMESMGFLKRIKEHGPNDPYALEIIGQISHPIPVIQTRRIPFRLEDGSFSGTDRIPAVGLIGPGSFKFFSWLVEGASATPDIIERGVRADDLAIFRVQETAEPGDIVLIKKPDPDPEKALRLVLAVADEKTRFVLGKVVSVMREEAINGDDPSS